MELLIENIKSASITIIDKDNNVYLGDISPYIVAVISQCTKLVQLDKDKFIGEEISIKKLL